MVKLITRYELFAMRSIFIMTLIVPPVHRNAWKLLDLANVPIGVGCEAKANELSQA